MGVGALAGVIGHTFRDPALLRQALTHRSHSSPHNERLEFLGDSVLNVVISRLLFERFPALPEGTLSRFRANLVNEETLCALASEMSIGGQLRLGEGESKSGGTNRPSILADALEAIFGAVFLDGGYEAASRVIERVYAPLLTRIDPDSEGKDPKTLLQEHLQGRGMALPRYELLSTRGKAHEQEFEVECLVADLGIRCLGEGSSRRRAEQAAARDAYRIATGRNV